MLPLTAGNGQSVHTGLVLLKFATTAFSMGFITLSWKKRKSWHNWFHVKEGTSRKYVLL